MPDAPGREPPEGRPDLPPAKPKPKPKPKPAPAKPPVDGFVPTKAVFRRATATRPAVVEISVTRNLPATVKVAEFRINYMMRSKENLPGFYGDELIKANDDRLLQNFTANARVMVLYGTEYPKPDGGGLGSATEPKANGYMLVEIHWKDIANQPAQGAFVLKLEPFA